MIFPLSQTLPPQIPGSILRRENSLWTPRPHILHIMSSAGVGSVEAYTSTIRKLLAEAQEVKPYGGIEPSLTAHNFGGAIEEIEERKDPTNKNYAAIETSCRNIFYELLASTSIEESSFGEVWNLFDILSLLSDLGKSRENLLSNSIDYRLTSYRNMRTRPGVLAHRRVT